MTQTRLRKVSGLSRKLLENGPKYGGICSRGCYFDSEDQARREALAKRLHEGCKDWYPERKKADA